MKVRTASEISDDLPGGVIFTQSICGQDIANFLTGEPGARRFFSEMIAAKGCAPIAHDQGDGRDVWRFRCRDGRQLTRIFEAGGEHAWPGQPRCYDGGPMGRGLRSRIDVTNLIVEEIRAGRARRQAVAVGNRGGAARSP